MKRTFFVKHKTWMVFISLLCVVVLMIVLLVCRRHRLIESNKNESGLSSVTTVTTTAATTATIKDEPLATVTGAETTGTITTTASESSLHKTETTTQGGSASSTKTTEKVTSAKKTSATKAETTKTTKTTKTTSGKKDYLDTSKLTYTQEDVGKVVGYSSLFKKDVIVVSVEEHVSGRGLKVIDVNLSDGNSVCIVECCYCHEMPCPDGGDEACSKYNVKLDAAKTCQQCKRPKGNGYYGTCLGLIDWDNGGKISCNSYSNCLKCGRPVGDGYNGTCHVTWGDYSGITTCNHYD